MLPVWYAFRGGATALVSQSKDGAYLAALLEGWGYRVIRGSSSKGGAEALAEMVEAARTGVVLVTPDGPRGPVHVCKPGAVVAAHRAGVPVYGVVVRMEFVKTFSKSWDAFKLPLPFARIQLSISEPLVVAATATREEVDAMVGTLQQVLRGV
jgi:lysophospholipid acyltransferase (LPLAT)-like uncharacterized protein